MKLSTKNLTTKHLTTKHLTTKNLTNLNKVASEVHRKYVAGTHVGEYASKEDIVGELSLNDVEDILCLHIHGLNGAEMSKRFGVPPHTLYNICSRKQYRKLNISFQKSKKKIRGKMVFEYDKEKVIEHFKNMPKELQSLSNGVLLEERLTMVTKILKSEMY